MLKYIYDSFSYWNYRHFASTLACSYVLYYLYKVVHRPQLFAGDGQFKDLLKKHLAILNEHVWPTFWAFTNHHQTICRVLFKSKPELPYCSEILRTDDNGEIGLDWVYNDDDNNKFPDPATRPTVIVMPGITGCSDASYVRHVVKEAKDLGYRSFVFHNRGLGNTPLKTTRTFCACNGDDLERVLSHVNERFPDSPLFIFAVSLGGVILTNYLSRLAAANQQQQQRDEKAGKGDVSCAKSNIMAALVVSAPWCSFETTSSLEQPVNWFLYNRFILNKLKGLVQKNMKIFQENDSGTPYDLEHVMKASSIREFDERLTSLLFGFESCKDYYTESSLVLKPLQSIRVPMLFLNARDDPFAPHDSIPLEAIQKNENMAIILTDYGGHIGFIEGATGRGRSLVERLFAQYFSGMLEDWKQKKSD